ncbi:MAG: 3-phosphoserine/phosphohydroxythreonine transaminase [Deltaproteobacteria bacterium]|jgi:phosphoserine aminotransferase|nr:3-phosphoserine/phosphohydroxythreonine transaminase [Deltaproteobacteria bacterium]MBT4526794.1 3-phosphoserine/phosphohydroxythreonine transaminase [Deltaproteobacteria bacterium]
MVYNFGAGPAMLPVPVMKQIQEEFLDYNNMGVSIIEISHRSPEFTELLNETDALFKELVKLPDNYQILYVHGGAQMQFSAIAMNFIGLKPDKKAVYYDSGNFANLAAKEAAKYGEVIIGNSSADTNYNQIPQFKADQLNEQCSYAYLTSNNTIFGTCWKEIPDTGSTPLVVDATSDILSRKMDYSKFGLLFAGAQKNLGPAGIAMVIIREDLLGHQLESTPKLLNYQLCQQKHSLTNTGNTFAIYTINRVLRWLKGKGGVAEIEIRNRKKARILYEMIDDSSFYKPHSINEHRSDMNVVFNLSEENLLQQFLSEAKENGLYALKGHRNVGGARASIYNAMPLEGVQSLADFMKDFERKNG